MTPNITFPSKNYQNKSYSISEIKNPFLSSIEAWTTNGEPICTAAETQSKIDICSDRGGGAIIIWEDYRSGSNYDIYAQGVNYNGTNRWAYNGIEICTASGDQQNPKLCTDGAGGAIIVWEDYRSGSSYDIYAQRINYNGTNRWAHNGIEICTASGDQQNPKLCTDGAGGAIIVWEDYRTGSNYDVYIQHVDSDGDIKWNINGTVICSEIYAQKKPQICSDDLGGAIVTWEDYRSGTNYDIYVQKVDFDGNILWVSNGTEICTETKDQKSAQLCNDGAGGSIIVWEDHRDHYDIFAQRIDFNGTIKWISNGTAICTAYNCQQELQVCSDGLGGAIVVWEDHREVIDISIINYDIYAQRVDSNGNIQWKYDGKEICTATEVQDAPQICSDGSNGAIITWMDQRSGTGTTGWHIYTQRVASNGVIKWNIDGLPICTISTHMYPQICDDENSGVIITWEDLRGSTRDVYAQRINIMVEDNNIIALGYHTLLFTIIGTIFLISFTVYRSLRRFSRYQSST